MRPQRFLSRPRAALLAGILAAGLAALPGAAQILDDLLIPDDPLPEETVPAPSADPTGPDFFLALETGGHRAFVRSLAFSADGDLLVSASDDRTVRIWDWQAGVTLRTLRGQIGGFGEGKVNAAAISPDSRLIATGGLFGSQATDGPYGDVRIFETGSGRMASVLSGLHAPVTGLAFSPDGRQLAASAADGRVQLWTRQAGADGPWRPGAGIDTGADGAWGVAFLPDGRLLTLSSLAGLGVWDLPGGTAGQLGASAEALTGAPLIGFALSGDGTRLAIGASDGAVQILNAADLSLLARLPDRPFLPAQLAFDGENRLIVGCSDRCAGRARAEIWDPAGRTMAGAFEGLAGAVFALAVAPDGRTVAAADGASHAIVLWDAVTLAPIERLAGAGAPVHGVGISAAGDSLAWGTRDPCPDAQACPLTDAPLDTRLVLPGADRSFTDPMPITGNATGFERARIAGDGLRLATAPVAGNRFETALLQVLSDGAALAELYRTGASGYYHAAASFLPGAERLVSGGGDGSIWEYDSRTGRFAGEYRARRGPGHSDDVLALAAASGRALLVSGSADQTLRLWNRETRAPVAALFATAGDWVLWTPDGYYHSSPGGDRYIGWHVNEGPDKAARFVTARQLKRHLNSPEIVRRAILLSDAGAAARDLRGTDAELARLLVNRPLDFELRVLNDGVPRDGRIEIEIDLPEDAGAEPESFGVMVNDRLVASLDGRDIGGAREVLSIPVQPGENRIRVTGVSSHGYLTERGGFVLNPVTEDAAPAGKLYVAAIGVQDYPFLPDACSGRSCDLRFPVADAAHVLDVIARRTAPMFSEVEARLILNADPIADLPEAVLRTARRMTGGDVLSPDSDTIEDELIDFLDLPGPQDTTIIFIAGHGITIDGDYYLIPSDARLRDDRRWRKSTLVEWRDIHDALEDAKGRRILFVDTCHAGAAHFNERLQKDSQDARILVMSATAANNVALEDPALGHGVFSYALIRGLDGKAPNEDGRVGILGLADYVGREVARLTDKRQTPVYFFPQPVVNFPVAQP